MSKTERNERARMLNVKLLQKMANMFKKSSTSLSYMGIYGLIDK